MHWTSQLPVKYTVKPLQLNYTTHIRRQSKRHGACTASSKLGCNSDITWEGAFYYKLLLNYSIKIY